MRDLSGTKTQLLQNRQSLLTDAIEFTAGRLTEMGVLTEFIGTREKEHRRHLSGLRRQAAEIRDELSLRGELE